MNQVQITSLSVKDDRRGSYMANYDYIVTDRLGAKREGNGSVAVSAPEAIESQIRFNIEKRLGYKSFDIHFPEKPRDISPKRPVLGVSR